MVEASWGMVLRSTRAAGLETWQATHDVLTEARNKAPA